MLCTVHHSKVDLWAANSPYLRLVTRQRFSTSSITRIKPSKKSSNPKLLSQSKNKMRSSLLKRQNKKKSKRRLMPSRTLRSPQPKKRQSNRSKGRGAKKHKVKRRIKRLSRNRSAQMIPLTASRTLRCSWGMWLGMFLRKYSKSTWSSSEPFITLSCARQAKTCKLSNWRTRLRL